MIKYFFLLSIPVYYAIVIVAFISVFVELKFSMLACEVEVTDLLGSVFFTVLLAPIVSIIPAYIIKNKQIEKESRK